MNQPKPARGLTAILQGAAPHGPDLEHEIGLLISERQRNARDLDNGRIPTAELEVPRPRPIPIPQPLSDDAKLLISKAIIQAAEQLAAEAKDAVTKYVEDAEALHAEVAAWASALVRNANETAAQVAERHAALLRSRPLFRQAMNGEVETLPNPVLPRAEAKLEVAHQQEPEQ